MRNFLKYLVTEYKRAAVRLPGILLKAAIPVLIAGMAVFCVQNRTDPGQTKKVKVGLSAPESALMNYGVKFIQGMDSVDSYCDIDRIEETAGKKRLADGDLDALIVLPDHTVEGILNGNNVKAKVYLANETNLKGLLLEELVKAGVGALQTAQGEIYAAGKLADLCGMDNFARTKMFEEIDAFNLKIYLNREQYFKVRRLSQTENESSVNYYTGSILTLYFLLAGIFFGSYLVREKKETRIFAKRKGIPIACQLACRFIVLFTCLCGLFILLCPALYFLPETPVTMQWSFPTLGVLTAAFLLAASWMLFLSALTERKSIFPIPVVFTALLMGYGGGCLVPLPLMPVAMQHLSAYNPAFYMRKAFLTLLTGNIQDSGRTAGFLLLFCVIAFVLSLLCSICPEKMTYKKTVVHRQKTESSLFFAVIKRMLSQKALWVSLVFTLFGSLLIVGTEKQSGNELVAYYYAEDSGYEKLLSGVTGLVTFKPCDSGEKLKRLVLSGKAECGYILQENLQNEILDGNGNWSITVYENEASTMTKLINEVLFERIFYQISMNKFERYIAEKEEFGDQEDIIPDREGTFSFDTIYLSPDKQEERTERSPYSFYPAHIMAVLCVILCTLTGVAAVMHDIREKRIYKSHAVRIRFLTILCPAVAGLVAGFLIWILIP